VPSCDPIYSCGNGKFTKLTSLNHTKWAADVTTVLIVKDAIEIAEGREDMPAANQRAAAADYRL
jgi:hypothetical protein